jgi:hypothetical protein
VLSLAFVPVFYAVIESLREAVQARRSKQIEPSPHQPDLANQEK